VISGVTQPGGNAGGLRLATDSRCCDRRVAFADLFLWEGVLPESIGGQVHLVRPRQAGSSRQDTPFPDEPIRVVERREQATAGNEPREIDRALRAVGLGNGDGVIGMRDRAGDPGHHGSILDPS